MNIEPVFVGMKFLYFYVIFRGFALPTDAENITNLRHNFAAFYFVQRRNYVLNVKGINSFLVAFSTECALRCTQHQTCLSFNIAEKPNKGGGNFLCEILPATTITAKQQLEESNNFHHWSIFVSIFTIFSVTSFSVNTSLADSGIKFRFTSAVEEYVYSYCEPVVISVRFHKLSSIIHCF